MEFNGKMICGREDAIRSTECGWNDNFRMRLTAVGYDTDTGGSDQGPVIQKLHMEAWAGKAQSV